MVKEDGLWPEKKRNGMREKISSVKSTAAVHRGLIVIVCAWMHLFSCDVLAKPLYVGFVFKLGLHVIECVFLISCLVPSITAS